MTNLIDTLFVRLRSLQSKAFMPFIPAGDPDLEFTQRLLATLAANGADLIEVGVPFYGSSPLIRPRIPEMHPAITSRFTHFLSIR